MAHASKGIALVTGASSGIGAVYADRLARRGYDLIIVARDQSRLENRAKRISHDTGRSIEVIAADLADKDGLSRVEAVLRTNPRITMLVNNAGIAASGPLLATGIELADSMVSLNMTALTHLTYAAVPGFVTRGGGTIINIASILGLIPEVLNGVYGGSKAFVIALSRSLHHELSGKGIRVQVVLPGAIETEFWEKAGTSVAQLPSEIVMQPEDLVDAALAGLDQGEFITIPSLPDPADWAAFENAREKMRPNLSLRKPAARYRVSADVHA